MPATTGMPASSEDGKALLAAHRAALNEAQTLTDLPTALLEIQACRRELREIAYNLPGSAGLLGRAGVAPRIEHAVAAAAAHGFDWRDRRAER